MVTFLVTFVRFFIIALTFILLARVLMSWVDPTFRGPVGRFLYETTEPLLAPIRRILPTTGMMDFSPLVLLIVLGIVMRLLVLR